MKLLKQRPTFEMWPIERLHGYAKNPRIHKPADIEKTARFIERFGFKGAIVARSTGEVIDGHLRLKALQKLGWKEVPVVLGDEWTPEEVKAFRLGINRSAEWAEWDEELLRLELSELDDAGFDLSVIDLELEPAPLAPVEGLTDADAVPEARKEAVSRNLDIWICGEHRLCCGDSTSSSDMAVLMDGESADLWLTDPPYNVALGKGGSVEEARKRHRRTDGLVIMNDSMPDEEFFHFLLATYTTAFAVTKPGASFYIWHADNEGYNFRRALREAGQELRQTIIWVKNTITLGRQDYQWKHEPCLYGWAAGGSHHWYSDRAQSTVLEFSKPARSELHPTMKPVELFEYLIKNSTAPGNLVLDSFGGSGTTMIACAKSGRRARLMELDPHYADVIVRRWQDFTGHEATLEATGRTFNETAADRGVTV